MRRVGAFVLGGLLLALLLAGVVSNFASSAPDGLDSASTRGCTLDAEGEIVDGTCMARGAREHEVGGPFADYVFAGVDHPFLATAVSGVFGVLVTFGLAAVVFWLARGRRRAKGALAATTAAAAGRG